MSHIVYIYDKYLIEECNRIPVIKNRASMVHELIKSFNLLENIKILPSRIATDDELYYFHSKNFIDYIKLKNNVDLEDLDNVDDTQLEFGLAYDTPLIERMYDFIKRISGGTLAAVDAILDGTNIAINWCGGWHHAQRDEAEGFCYINDIAIGIQRLRSKYKKILYIDLDIHHGNGVENAFLFSKSILTLSFHQFDNGFYPGSGNVTDCGLGNGRGYAINFPFKYYINGLKYIKYFKKITQLILDTYKPEVCVVQCGADIIVGDPLGGTNIIPEDIGECIVEILSWNLPTIYLGGGGYNLPNACRYWTYLTSIICNNSSMLRNDIPDNNYYLSYSPDYEMIINRKKMTDCNSDEYLENNFIVICDSIKKHIV